VIYSTKDVHPRERLSYWREVATRGYVEHDFQPLDRPSFNGNVKITSLPGIGVSAFTAEGHKTHRSVRNAAHEDSGDLLLSAIFEGKISVLQDGREAIVEGPGLYLVDPVRPFDLILRERCTHVIAKIPRALLEARIGLTGDLTGRSFAVSDGIGALALGMMKLLPAHAETLDDTSGLKVAEQLMDLAALTLNANRENLATLSSPRTVALLRLKSTIERLLIEPGLKPERIAAEAGISVRYANDLLAEENWSIERYLNERRLERCRNALEDAAQSHRSIGEIAFKWGFSDLSHFGRRFKARYGLSPTDYRRNAQGRAGPSRASRSGRPSVETATGWRPIHEMA
jgi:AraC-like DNA-binding protein